MINNIENDIHNGKNKNDKLALFYIDINDRKYYYSYNFLDCDLSEVYDSYRIVNCRKAKRLLNEQMNIG